MFLKKKYIKLITIILFSYIQLSFDYNINQYDCNFNKFSGFIDNHHYPNNQSQNIYIESDYAEIYYPEKIKLSGNILIKQADNVIKSNTLIIYHPYNSSNILGTTLHADGNVFYYTKDLILTGSYAQFNFNNKNADLYQGTYYITKPHIYGSANSIMQRQHNRYTIIKKGSFTSCISSYTYWNIAGSKIVYDYLNNNIYIWNAYLNIKKIPLFYSPYLLLCMNNNNNNNILESYIPRIKYNSKYGCILKAPFPLIFSKYYSGNISPYYITNVGIGLSTKIHYTIIPGTGLFMFNIIESNIVNNKRDYKKKYKLYWKHHGMINKKWHFNADYIFRNDFKNHAKTFNKEHSKIVDNSINQKILCYYNNEYCKISLAYLNSLNKNILQNNCTYSLVPRLEMYLFFYPTQNNFFSFHIFNQFSKFVPSNNMYPETIRIHTEPLINFTKNKHWIRFNTEIKLKMTHYQQNNVNNYNKHQNNNQYYLQNKINRIIPQFKVNGKMIFQKKTNKIRKYKYFLEPKLQYLYVPYHFQENIGIYDSKMIHADHNNLFHGVQYSGLDRITFVNQIISNITMRCFSKNNDRFYLSAGQIFNVTHNNNFINNKKINQYSSKSVSNPKIQLCSSGIGYWNINNDWSIYAEIQYDTSIKTLSLGNTTLEYIGKKNTIFQTNYRYINSKYFQKTLIHQNNLKCYHTISQLGFITCYTLTNNWIISYSTYHNIKYHSLIDQTIGIQYVTPCWVFSIVFERNIIDWNNKSHNNLYENQIKFHFNLSHMQSKLKSNTNKLLNSKIIPYQHITQNI